MIFRSKKGGTPGEMPFLDHLEELRWRILWSVLAIIAGALVGFYVVTHFQVLEILIDPIRPLIPGEKLKYLSPSDPFFVTLKLALTVGFILAFPIVVAQVWAFVSPALMPRERRAIVPALYLGLLLFCGGVALAYFLVLPITLKFFMSFQTETLEQSIVIGPYMSMVVKILLAFGILFELPVVIMVLAALGLVTSKFLIEKRRFAIAAMAVIAAFVTPGDAITLTVFMIGPLLLLYELSIGLAKLVERRRARTLVESVAIIALLFVAAPASAQQTGQQPPQRPAAADTTRPKTPREIVFNRLRTLNDSERPDTARADTAAADTAERPSEMRRVPVQDSPDFPMDSIMRQLAELPGFAATRYRGTQAEFSADSSELVLRGTKDQRAGVSRDNQSMLADSLVTFNEMTSIACGFGNPIVAGGESGAAPVSGQRVCYDTRRGVGMFANARTQISEGANWFVTGDLYSRGNDSFAHDAAFTDCSLDVPHYHFALKDMKIVRGDVVVGRNVTLNFGDVPVFWLPFFMQSLKRGRRSGLLMPEFSVNDIVRRNAGYNRRIKDIGFYWAISDNWGGLISADWWSNNYTALEGSFDYTYPQKFMNGGVTFKRFWGNTGNTEFSVAGQHSMEPNERTRIAVNGQYVTSSAFVEERSYDPRELRQSINSTASLSRRFDWGSISLQTTRDHYLTNDEKRYTLPSLGLNLATIPLWEGATWTGSGQVRRTGVDMADTEADPNQLSANVSSGFNWGRLSWSQSINSVDDNIRRKIGTGADTSTVLTPIHDVNWSSSINFQQNLIGTTTFTPSISVGGRMLKNDTSEQRFVSAPIRMDMSAELKADLFGFWPGVGALERIRHRLSPTIRYSYSPSAAIDSLSDPLKARVFGAIAGRERNTITIGVSQTIEGKFREDENQTAARQDSARADSATADPTQPRKLPQARKVSILSLSTDAVAYDFVAAREQGRGIQTAQISNSINSDLLRGLQLTITHELFRGDTLVNGRTAREFDPHLQRINASFSLSSNSWLFRALGLSRKSEAQPQTGSQETPAPTEAQGGPAPGPDFGIIGNRGRGDRDRIQQPTSRGPIGSWNASFNFTIERAREEATTGIGLQGSQMMTTTFSFQPTQLWSVNWSTGYSFTEKEFTDHVLVFTRQMHDWDANFDFLKAQNGNFSFQFRVSLRANPDLKFDYNQRSNINERRRSPQ
jgi:sec-independent protein translocase protein TatC